MVHDQRDWRPTLSSDAVARQARPWSGTLTAAALAQLVVLAVLTPFTGLGPIGWLAATGYTAAVLVGLAVGVRRAGTGSLGPADKVTLARSTLVGAVTALIADHAHQDVLLVTLVLVALPLDAVDGWVARRTGTASALGARFDMEVDAFLILMLSVSVATRIGPWVLAIGLMRYAFVAAGRALVWMRTPVPSTFAGKAVAAVQGVVLVVSVAGILPGEITTVAVAGALAALVWSFGRSVVWLHLHGDGDVDGHR